MDTEIIRSCGINDRFSRIGFKDSFTPQLVPIFSSKQKDLNVFAEFAFIALISLAAKNGILIIALANQYRERPPARRRHSTGGFQTSTANFDDIDCCACRLPTFNVSDWSWWISAKIDQDSSIWWLFYCILNKTIHCSHIILGIKKKIFHD